MSSPVAVAVARRERARIGAPSPAAGEPRARGERLLRALERPVERLEAAASRLLPERLDPLAQTGAVANTCLLVALVTGILLLFWYVPSVHQAHASVAAMEEQPWLAGLMRSLHRYSSDAAMFFALVHALRLFLQRRFLGARWLAWTTGLALLGLTWLVGWLGYWLVWDERAKLVAQGTARLVDRLPIFIDPLSRSFLTDGGINSLLFFVVFFAHVLLPLAMVLGLWLHLLRLRRSRFVTGRTLSAWIVAVLVVASVAVPATSAAPARMASVTGPLTMDLWYLLPVALTDRMSSGGLWSLGLVGGALLLAAPWALARSRRRVAAVDPQLCNACTRCVQDCPFAAITMEDRAAGDARPELQLATVDPARCVGCGICAGSCDSSGIGLPWMPAPDARQLLDAWLAADLAAGHAPVVILGCAESAAGALAVDAETGACPDLPGARALVAPCLGWFHALTIERALRHGASRILMVGCHPGTCRYREGVTWTEQRVDGAREPALRRDRVDASRVRVLHAGAGERPELLAAARPARPAAAPRRAPTWLFGLVLAAGCGVAVVLGSDVAYAPPVPEAPELVVSFAAVGQATENCRDLTPEELERLPVHMRRPRVCDRGRAPVRLRVVLDGQVALERAYEPGGLWSDQQSVAVETLTAAPGPHAVEVAIGTSPDAAEWTARDARTVLLSRDARRVVLFDRGRGFTWH